MARKLDRALNTGGELWNAWALAHLAELFHSGRPPTITDVPPEVFQVRAYAPSYSGPLPHRLLRRRTPAARSP